MFVQKSPRYGCTIRWDIEGSLPVEETAAGRTLPRLEILESMLDLRVVC